MISIYSDVEAFNNVSPELRNAWEGEIVVRQKYREYFTGHIFKQTVPLEVGADEDEPELYPVGINLAKMLCIAQADSTFGEWDEDIVKFEPRQDDNVGQPEKDASDLTKLILGNSDANSLLWELALDREIFGGAAMKIAPDLAQPGHIRWSRVALDSFFPIWDPDSEDTLLEVYVIIEMTREQAKAKYGIETQKDTVRRVEHWTPRMYENRVDGKRIDAYSGTNPWGFVPFVFIPRMRSITWWGDSLVEDIMRVQDELNMRIADLGEAVNYNAHPVRWGYNLPKSFNTKNYPIGPNILWDAGRVIGQSPEPHIEMLEAKNPIPSGTFDYINFLYDWGRTSVFAPPIAFGEDNGGGQRSGITLEIRMWPLVKAVRRSRSYLGAGLLRAMKMSALILKQKSFGDVSVRALERIIRGDIVPRFAPIMPRDQAATVDEVVKRMQTNPPSISLETAVKKLGDGTAEVERIKEMVSDEDLYARENKKFEEAQKANEQKLAAQKDAQEKKLHGMNSGTGNAPKENVSGI